MALEPTLQSLLQSWSQASEADSGLKFDKWFEQESARHGVAGGDQWPAPFNNIATNSKMSTQDDPWAAMRHLRTTYPSMFEPKRDGTITLWDEKDAAQQQAIEDAEAAQSQAELDAIATAPKAPSYSPQPTKQPPTPWRPNGSGRPVGPVRTAWGGPSVNIMQTVLNAQQRRKDPRQSSAMMQAFKDRR